MRRLSAIWVAAAVAGAPALAWAAGFAIQEQSGRALGTAFIGEEAGAFDASTIFFNPAGLTRLEGTQLVVSGQLIWPQAEFHNQGSSVNPALGGGPLLGPNGDPDELGLVPNVYLAHRLTDRVAIGLGVTAPFGLRTKYDREWVGRYHADLSDLRTFDIAPTLAIRLTDWASVGAGLDVQYARAKLSNAIDLGGVCQIFAPQQGLPPSVCAAVGLTPQSADGFARVEGDSWGVGFNFGLLLDVGPRTRLGFSYRSRINHTLKGDAEFDVPERAAILQSTGALVDTTGKADLKLPDIYRVGLFHQATDQWAIVTGFTWTNWERFDRLVFDFANPNQPTIVEPENWGGSFRAGLGALFTPTDHWTFRGGFAWDQTPVPNATFRTARVPDGDRYWLTAGIGYAVTDWVRVDVGYAHIFAPSVRIENADPITGHVLRGEYTAAADIFGFQLTGTFH